MAAWLGSSEEWKAFAPRWAACLQSPPTIRYLKMREAAGLSGQFRGMCPSDRDAKLRALGRVIREHAAAAIHCSLDLHAFEKTIRPAGKPFSDPYFWPFHITVMAISIELAEQGCTTPADVVFDEHAIFGERTRHWYPLVRSLIADPADAAVMPLEPVFQTDMEAPQLQASDMLAWILRRSAEKSCHVIEQWQATGDVDTSGLPPDDFGWLVHEELRHVPFSRHSQYMTRDRLDGIVELVNEHLRTDFQSIPGAAEHLREFKRLANSRPHSINSSKR